jgi:hypothetical protein
MDLQRGDEIIKDLVVEPRNSYQSRTHSDLNPGYHGDGQTRRNLPIKFQKSSTQQPTHHSVNNNNNNNNNRQRIIKNINSKVFGTI